MIKQSPIAVVGMGGVFPGATDIDTFWNNIITKTDTACQVPEDRWAVNPGEMVHPGNVPDKAYSNNACLVHNVKFNPGTILKNIDRNIRPDVLDPLYAMVLHAGEAAFSSCRTQSINRERTGVALAAIALPTDASSAVTRDLLGPAIEGKLFQHSPSKHSAKRFRSGEKSLYLDSRVTSLPATLLARALSLRGSSYTLDAACASSIYAVKLACDELLSYRADAMLAGGVSRPDCLYTQVGFSQLRALSPSGRCSPFDRNADGLVVGEGAGIMVLKRLEDALSHNDRIFGIIRGIGLSNDTRGNLLAPDMEGQLRAMEDAYTSADWSPLSIDLIECHGAGTPVGDATEITSLAKLWGNTGWSKGQCAIGSVKSMIGHLLTAAGAASMIKTLLALKHETFPPSLNFNEPPAKSPLHYGPFHVQTETAPWLARKTNLPLRAAVSAFGFGGINGHLLLEQWTGESNISKHYFVGNLPKYDAHTSAGHQYSPVAIVGMDAVFGHLSGLKSFEEYIFSGKSIIGKKPAHRWKGLDDTVLNYLKGHEVSGGYMDKVGIDFQEFHIPPRNIPDILPQHLLMLKTAVTALEDAHLIKGVNRTRMGIAIGMGFDMEETNFHLRWHLANWVRTWNKRYGLQLDEIALSRWLETLQNQCHPPLTANRTLGALGSMIASRIARELGFGGPSFTVSAEEASGIKALDIGVRSLQQKETKLMLVGAVDLPGDLRNIIATHEIRPFSKGDVIYPFVKNGGGTLPGEGAASLVLKRYDDAVTDNDRIYGVIKGIGMASGGDIRTSDFNKTTYTRSINRALAEAGISPDDIDYMETHGSGDPMEDPVEANALHDFFSNREELCALGTVKPNIGHTGAVSGLASVVKSGLCLYREKIPPLMHPPEEAHGILDKKTFRIPTRGEKWISKNGSRRACVGTITQEGNCAHVVLELLASSSGDSKGKHIIQNHHRCPSVLDPKGLVAGAAKSDRFTRITLPVSGMNPSPSLPETPTGSGIHIGKALQNKETPSVAHNNRIPPFQKDIIGASPLSFSEFVTPLTQNQGEVAEAHKSFLNLSKAVLENYGNTFFFQTVLLEKWIPDSNGNVSNHKSIGSESGGPTFLNPNNSRKKTVDLSLTDPPVFSRKQCLEFASGSVAKVLGPEFGVLDTYKTRVRLPEEPLMLVDRILSIEGEKLSLGSGKLVTEHDVQPGAWYLDGNHAPVCISVEAGQADLFLCVYLGIDHLLKGERTYRLLDATVTFHRELPVAGETIQYHIEIEKFVRQGDTHLFFFNFKGFIGKDPLITMTDGCAGFFTGEEVENSGGIILTDDEKIAIPRKTGFLPLVPMAVEKYSDDKVEALRNNDPAGCFGSIFNGVFPTDTLKLPGERMHLIDRVLHLDPEGGRYGLGIIRAETDIHPDDWFLTCHFIDDMVMPGTLMYECCAHTLRIFIQRMGWVTEKPGVFYEPVTGVASRLKCRGPVTPDTRHVVYQVEIKEIGCAPEPFAIADAHMFADGHHIVMFTDISMNMTGITGQELKDFWADKIGKKSPEKPIFDFKNLVEFASGKPSKAFGKPYEIFDDNRFIARLPRPPYLFMDRIVKVQPKPWVLVPDGWVETEYEVPSDAWYFTANRMALMPYCILLEIALQPCGWMAAFMGSALKSKRDLKFRNLGGRGVIHQDVLPTTGKLTIRTRLTQVSEAKDMIIETFDFLIMKNQWPIYTGNTYFGFFTPDALMHQTGLQSIKERELDMMDTTDTSIRHQDSIFQFTDYQPYFPEQVFSGDKGHRNSNFAMPAKALRMIDSIDTYHSTGGPAGLGYIKGTKKVDPDEWFFKAHFYQDPVWPGSLGIESFYQLIKYIARDHWEDLVKTHRFSLVAGKSHQWIYRGQVIPTNQTVEVIGEVTEIKEPPMPGILADGFLMVDGLYIYEMKNFGLNLVPKCSKESNGFPITRNPSPDYLDR